MFASIWNSLLFHPLVNGLIFLYQTTGNLGLAIIVFTVALRVVMTPLVIPGLKMSKKMAELAPELAKLKEQYKDDKQGLVLAQTQLYKQHGANPAAGCLPQVIQLVVLIALFNALNLVIHNQDSAASVLNPILYAGNQLPTGVKISSNFAYLNLAKPDTITVPGLPIPLPGIFLILSAISQLLSAKMMSPTISAENKIAAKTESDTDDAMVSAQKQMLYLFPLMTIVVGFNFPSGLVLYWLTFSVASIVQQYLITGWGGLTPWLRKLNLLK